MPNPVRGYYWQLRKKGVDKKTAIAKTAKKFGLRVKSGGKRGDYWIQDAIKPERKGVLRAKVKRRYGEKGFKKSGYRKVIRQEILEKLAKEPGATGKQARLALTLKRMR